MGGPSTSDHEQEDVTTGDLTGECAVCKGIANSRCGGCQKVGYCSREHQKQHWRDHKGECCAWKISQSSQLGRYLEAVRDIKPGEIIIQERPLLITPPRITPPICLGCYSEFKPDGVETDDGNGVKPRSCKNGCGWPMCQSDACANSKVHQAECTISKARGKVTIRTLDAEHPLYQSIGILRALGIKDNDSEAFDKLMSLESNTEKRKAYKDSIGDQDQEELPGSSITNPHGIRPPQDMGPEVSVKIIRSFFQRTDISEDWILNLIGIIETNGHEIPIPDSNTGHINRRIIGVYHTSSLIEHNCQPNCIKSWDLRTKAIVIRSCSAIKKGTHLSISYVDPLWGTNDRVNLLQMTKFFTCKCDRCIDPTELGCHVSSLRCQHPKCTNVPSQDHFKKGLPSSHGMIVPENPFKPEMDWKCLSCGEDYSVNYVSSLIHKAGQEMEELQEKIGDISAKEAFLKRFLKTLSPNHFFLLEIKVELAQLYGRTAEEPLHLLAPKKLLRKIQLCEDLLTVLNVISPGYNRLRALIIYELQAGVFTLSRLRRSVGEISMEQHLDELMQCGKWMTEVIKVLGWEDKNSIEKKRADGAERDLELLRSAVLSLQASGVGATASGCENTENSSLSSRKKTNDDHQGSADRDEEEDRSHLSVDQESFIEEVF